MAGNATPATVVLGEPEITTHVDYFLNVGLFAEHDHHEVASRDPLQAAREAPEHAYGFSFYDRVAVTVTVNGEAVPLSGTCAQSGAFYIDAEVLTREDVRQLPGDHGILLSNMRANNWPLVVRGRGGNFAPLLAADAVIRTT